MRRNRSPIVMLQIGFLREHLDQSHPRTARKPPDPCLPLPDLLQIQEQIAGPSRAKGQYRQVWGLKMGKMAIGKEKQYHAGLFLIPPSAIIRRVMDWAGEYTQGRR